MNLYKKGEVSREEVYSTCRNLGHEFDVMLPRSMKIDHNQYDSVWAVWGSTLPEIILHFIAREREVRDLILADMVQDSKAYEEGYSDGAEAMRKALSGTLAYDLEGANQEIIRRAAVPPPEPKWSL